MIFPEKIVAIELSVYYIEITTISFCRNCTFKHCKKCEFLCIFFWSSLIFKMWEKLDRLLTKINQLKLQMYDLGDFYKFPMNNCRYVVVFYLKNVFDLEIYWFSVEFQVAYNWIKPSKACNFVNPFTTLQMRI